MALNLYENSAFFLTIFYSAKDVNQPVPWLYVKGPRDIGGVQQNPDEEKGSLGRPSKSDRFHKTWRMRRAVQTALRPGRKNPGPGDLRRSPGKKSGDSRCGSRSKRQKEFEEP